RSTEPEQERDREQHDEEPEVAPDSRSMYGGPLAGGAARAEGKRGDADEGHGDRRQHERRTDNRSDRDVVGLGARDQGNDRDDRLGQRSAYRREQAPDRPLAQPKPVSGPFDCVREEVGAEEKNGARRPEPDAAQPPSSGHAPTNT